MNNSHRRCVCWLAILFVIAVVFLTGTAVAAAGDDASGAEGSIAISLHQSLVIIAGALVIVVVISFVLWKRFTDRVGHLLERIEELQAKNNLVVLSPTEKPRAVETERDFRPNVSADVLAGRTEEIDSIVNAGGDAENLLQQTILATHQSLNQNLSPRELADKLNISLRTLQRNLGRVLNCTPRELILSLKMREAHNLLRTHKYNVTEVAMQLGFSSSSHFSRRFKTFYKQSPIDVIQSAREALQKIE